MNKNNVKAKLTKKIFLKWNMKFSNAIHSKVLCILCLFLSLYHVHCATFSFDLRSFIYRCKLLLMILHGLPDDGAASEWKIDGNYVYARSKRQHHWLPSKILSKLFPSFRMYEEKMANLLSTDGDGKYEPNLGKNTTHSSWNDEEQHPELVKRIACVVISLPPPVLIFDFFS